MVSKTALRKLTSLILCFMLVFPSALAADNGIDYQGHWAEDSIKVLFEKGFVTGYTDGSFKPDKEISRAEFMAIINRAFDFNEKAEISFEDVKEGEWHYEHVAKAVKAGYIKGFTDGTMRPTQNITRQEAAVIIARILDIEKEADDMIIASLKDGNKIPEWSAKGIAAVISKGYINKNKDGSFDPAKPLTRAEMAFAVEKSYVKGIKKLYAKPGVFTGGNIDGSVKIDNKGITLMDSVINGDLILGEGIGDGDVHLLNVTVKGETLVKGGGENSIIIENCQFSKIIIIKEGNKVRILAKGNTSIDEVDVQSGAKLESENLTGEGFGYVTIAEGLDGDALVELIGNFESVEIRAEGIQVQATGGTIGNLEVAQGATNVNIELANDAKVTTFTTNAPATVTGTGKIETAQVNVSGTKIEVPVTKVEAPAGVKVDAPKQTPTPAPTTPTTGGGGGGSSRDRDDDDTPPTVAVSGIIITTDPVDVSGLNNNATVTVTLSTSTSGASIYYTLDGTIPTKDSTLYKGEFTVTAPGTSGETVTVRAIGMKSGYNNSVVVTKKIMFISAEADVDARILRAISQLKLENTGISEVTYGNKTALFKIEDPSKPILEFAGSGVIELFKELFTDVTNADIYIGGNKVGTIANPAVMTDSELITAVGQQLIQPLIGEGKSLATATLADLAGKSASAQVNISVGVVDYTATYGVEFVLTEAALLEDVDARILRAISQLKLENTGISEVTYGNKTALFKIEAPTKPILEFTGSGVIELFKELFTDVTNADIYIGENKVGTIANPTGMSDAELITAIGQQLIQPLIGEGKSLVNSTLKDLAGKGATAGVTISAGAVDFIATYGVDFVLTEAALLADMDTRISDAIDRLTLTDTGISEVTYADKTALFKIEYPAKPILEFAGSGVIELFKELFTDVTNADIYIGGNKEGTIANPAVMTDSELITAIGQQLIQPLIGEGKSLATAALADLAGKSASAEVTISAGLVEYTARYTVEFVAKEYTVTVIAENES